MAKQTYINQGGFSVNSLSIENLPNKVIESKAELVSFCFLLLGISEENCRKGINCSKITEKFWREFKKLKDYEQSFSKFTEKDLNNSFKYIVYLPACQKFEINLVLKTYFRLLESNLIDNTQPIAEIGKIMLNWLTKIKELLKNDNLKMKENIELWKFTNEIIEYNIADMYINVKQLKNSNINDNKFIFSELITKKKNYSNISNITSNDSLKLIENNISCELSENKLSKYLNDDNKTMSKNKSDILSISNNSLNDKKFDISNNSR